MIGRPKGGACPYARIGCAADHGAAHPGEARSLPHVLPRRVQALIRRPSLPPTKTNSLAFGRGSFSRISTAGGLRWSSFAPVFGYSEHKQAALGVDLAPPESPDF
jgi:hypothetical protein